MINYYCNTKTGEIGSYNVEDDLTDLSRGILLAYGDYLTTGFKTKEEAEKWAQEWSVCLKCRNIREGKPGDICSFCGGYWVSHKNRFDNPCAECKGWGKLFIAAGIPNTVKTCDDCNGTGVEMKILYKGTFNCSGQDVVIYRHAHSKAQAKRLMLVELAYTLNTSIWMIRMHFGDWCTNYIVEKEDE